MSQQFLYLCRYPYLDLTPSTDEPLVSFHGEEGGGPPGPPPLRSAEGCSGQPPGTCRLRELLQARLQSPDAFAVSEARSAVAVAFALNGCTVCGCWCSSISSCKESWNAEDAHQNPKRRKMEGPPGGPTCTTFFPAHLQGSSPPHTPRTPAAPAEPPAADSDSSFSADSSSCNNGRHICIFVIDAMTRRAVCGWRLMGGSPSRDSSSALKRSARCTRCGEGPSKASSTTGLGLSCMQFAAGDAFLCLRDDVTRRFWMLDLQQEQAHYHSWWQPRDALIAAVFSVKSTAGVSGAAAEVEPAVKSLIGQPSLGKAADISHAGAPSAEGPEHELVLLHAHANEGRSDLSAAGVSQGTWTAPCSGPSCTSSGPFTLALEPLEFIDSSGNASPKSSGTCCCMRLLPPLLAVAPWTYTFTAALQQKGREPVLVSTSTGPHWQKNQLPKAPRGPPAACGRERTAANIQAAAAAERIAVACCDGAAALQQQQQKQAQQPRRSGEAPPGEPAQPAAMPTQLASAASAADRGSYFSTAAETRALLLRSALPLSRPAASSLRLLLGQQLTLLHLRGFYRRLLQQAPQIERPLLLCPEAAAAAADGSSYCIACQSHAAAQQELVVAAHTMDDRLQAAVRIPNAPCLLFAAFGREFCGTKLVALASAEWPPLLAVHPFIHRNGSGIGRIQRCGDKAAVRDFLLTDSLLELQQPKQNCAAGLGGSTTHFFREFREKIWRSSWPRAADCLVRSRTHFVMRLRSSRGAPEKSSLNPLVLVPVCSPLLMGCQAFSATADQQYRAMQQRWEEAIWQQQQQQQQCKADGKVPGSGGPSGARDVAVDSTAVDPRGPTPAGSLCKETPLEGPLGLCEETDALWELPQTRVSLRDELFGCCSDTPSSSSCKTPSGEGRVVWLGGDGQWSVRALGTPALGAWVHAVASATTTQD
ncbi:hypothetical protein cyc_00973 [Cyclospora cayetanensis]|uniref:Uncharacterized protein n=1 Tax=Cyclospora cayetanensis TaxID=88456 RepID=A0A1D3D951_9EIME|nr:hypothetical protein cyc_00973 [Cyclospora cayetanensis]